MFVDRIDAAQRLARALTQYRGQNPLVLAIPRGSVAMGKIIAAALGGELDVVLVKKLRAPFSPEFAVGSIDESGWAYVASHAREAGADEAYLAREQAQQLALLRQRRAQCTPARAPIDAAGRVAIVIDDGLATGATMIAALHSVRARQPRRLVCAVPVAAPQSLDAVAPYADEVVCLTAPIEFQAVGQFYLSFPQVDDEFVIATLAESQVAAAKIKAP
ncbi:MAG: phosphoribosyltransferase family protein [Pseudomonadota bacterium]